MKVNDKEKMRNLYTRGRVRDSRSGTCANQGTFANAHVEKSMKVKQVKDSNATIYLFRKTKGRTEGCTAVSVQPPFSRLNYANIDIVATALHNELKFDLQFKEANTSTYGI